MLEIITAISVIVLGVLFAIALSLMLRTIARQARAYCDLVNVMRAISTRVYDLEVGKFDSNARTVDLEFKRMHNMNRLVNILHKVQTKQNEIILRAAGFNRREVAKLIEKQTNEGVYALINELGTVQSLQANALRAESRGEREEISATEPDLNKEKETRQT